MLSECWLVKLIRETFTQEPRRGLSGASFNQAAAQGLPLIFISKAEAHRQPSPTHKGEAFFSSRYLKLSHSGEQKDHRGASSLVPIPSCGGLDHTQAWQKENRFLQFRSKPKERKGASYAVLFFFFFKDC